MRVVVIVRVHGGAVGESGELRRHAHAAAVNRGSAAGETEIGDMAAQDDAAFGDRARECNRETIQHGLLAEADDCGRNVCVTRLARKLRDARGQPRSGFVSRHERPTA